MDAVDVDPLVSVVVPTYGRSEFLRDALRSVGRQTYPRVELVVVDDCSPEPVGPLVDDLDLDGLAAVRPLRHAENRGANAARNTGIEAADGDLVAFLDDDDRWEPTKIERQVRALRADPTAGVAFTGQRYVDADGETTRIRRPATEGGFLENLIDGENFGPFSSVLVAAAAIDAAGTLDERFPAWQDREWYFRLAEHVEYVSVPAPLTIRRYAGQDQISDDYETKRDVAYPLFLSTHAETAARRGERRRFEATLARTVASAALNHGAYRDAIGHALRSIRADPREPGPYGYLLVALGGDYTYDAARRLSRTVSTLRESVRALGDGGGSGG